MLSDINGMTLSELKCPTWIHDGTETFIPLAVGSTGSSRLSPSPGRKLPYSGFASSQGNHPCFNWYNPKWPSQQLLQLNFLLCLTLLSSLFTTAVPSWRIFNKSPPCKTQKATESIPVETQPITKTMIPNSFFKKHISRSDSYVFTKK